MQVLTCSGGFVKKIKNCSGGPIKMGAEVHFF
jgi:hypothetical protein